MSDMNEAKILAAPNLRKKFVRTTAYKFTARREDRQRSGTLAKLQYNILNFWGFDPAKFEV